MPTEQELIVALQHGDSVFPSGGGSFSWGLEPAHRDGLVTGPKHVAAFVRTQLLGRWQPFDRPALCAAHRSGNPADWQALDSMVERMTPAAELRAGSRRAGAALLAIHTRLGTAGADDYYQMVRAGEAEGHAAVMQGAMWRGIGLGEAAACAVSAHGLVAGVLGAAVRLNLIGHATAQAIRGEIGPAMAEAIAAPLPPLDAMASFTPLAEIAGMRHSDQAMRLFAT